MPPKKKTRRSGDGEEKEDQPSLQQAVVYVPPTDENAGKKCDARFLRPGDKLSRESFMTIIEADNGSGMCTVRNTEGRIWQLSKDLIEQECYSANQARTETRLTKTQLAQSFHNTTGDAVFTTEFTKANGDQRVLTGVVHHRDPVMGRAFVRDLEIEEGHNERQVDNRTLTGFVCKNKAWTMNRGTRALPEEAEEEVEG